MQHAIIFGRHARFFSGLLFPIRCRQKFTEAEEQTQCVCFRQVVRSLIPVRDKFLRLIGRSQQRLQLGKRTVVKTKIRGGKSFLQDRRSRE